MGTTQRFLQEPVSAPDPLDLVAQPLQLGDDALPLVALNLDPPILDRPSGATPILELRGQFEQTGFIKWDIRYGRHALATPAFGFPTQADHSTKYYAHHWLLLPAPA